MRHKRTIPSVIRALDVVEQSIVVVRVAFGCQPFCVCAPPDDLTAEGSYFEHRVHEQFEVVAGGGVAVEVDAARRFEDAVQLHHALRHHREVGHHVVLSEERAHGLQEVRQLLRPAGHHVPVGALGLLIPMPGVVEGVDLGGGAFAARLLEQDVVRGVGVERRVEVDEINALIRDVLPAGCPGYRRSRACSSSQPCVSSIARRGRGAW